MLFHSTGYPRIDSRLPIPLLSPCDWPDILQSIWADRFRKSGYQALFSTLLAWFLSTRH